MAQRSTRNKIRWQSGQAIEKIREAIDHYAKMKTLAGDQSPFVNEYVPHIVTYLEVGLKAAEQFDERL